MRNEFIKQEQEAAEMVRDAAVPSTEMQKPEDQMTPQQAMQYIASVNVYIMLCEIARRLPPPLDDTK